MNSAQRKAFNELLRYADQMGYICDQLACRPAIDSVMYQRIVACNQAWAAARNRYFELEHEAKQSRTAQQMARKVSGVKSTAGR